MSSNPISSYQDALDLLIEDHRELQEMFKEFDELDDPGDKRVLLRRVYAALDIHTQIEEEIFYPAVRDALADAESVSEAELEHELASNLAHELVRMSIHDAQFDTRFAALVDTVNHHFAAEETEMFGEIARTAPDLETVAQEMRERKEELLAELDDPDEDEGEDDERDESFDDE